MMNMPMFTAALFITDQHWKKPKCLKDINVYLFLAITA